MKHEYSCTPRNLGNLAVANPCPDCFWWLSKLRFRAPLSHFGAAVFSDCQRMQEAMIGYYLDKLGHLPKQFAPFDDITGRNQVKKNWQEFGYMHKSGVWLYGSPDEVFDRRDASVVIGDHKTSHPKDEEDPDPLLPLYEIQIIGYGNIAEVGLRLGKTSGLFLLYWDLQHKAVISDPGSFVEDGKLWTYMIPHVHEVELDYSRLDGLLKEAKKIWKSKVPPEGNVKCKGCDEMKAVFALQKAVEKEMRNQDQTIISMSGHDQTVVNTIAQRNYDRQSRVYAAFDRLLGREGAPVFSTDTMAANWQYFT